MTIAIWNCICYNTPSLEMNFSEIGCMISVVKIIYGTGNPRQIAAAGGFCILLL